MGKRRHIWFLAGTIGLLATAAVADPVMPLPTRKPDPNAPTWSQKVCAMIERAAGTHGLPPEFFSRLIWQESSFNPQAISRVGAQGIAQFMPGTANERRLDDPFDAEKAIQASASLLRDLRARFGNLGLAAAAYNGGPNRVANWLAEQGGLAAETRDYVFVVTGRTAEDWAIPPDQRAANDDISDGKLFTQGCAQVVARLKVREHRETPDFPTAPRGPWGVQVAGNFSRSIALASYQRLQSRHRGVLGGRDPMIVGGRNRSRGTRAFYRVGVPAETQQAALELCNSLRAAGGFCIVMKN